MELLQNILHQAFAIDSIWSVVTRGLIWLGIALVIIVYAGFLWMTSAGNEEKVGEAKKIITAGIIGLIIIFRMGLFDFLKGLGSISPLLTLDQVIIRQESGIAKVDALIFGNFAPLPTTLPSITSPLDELTAEEKDILAKISSYSQPVFTEVTPSGPFERVDLFNF